LLTSTRHNPGPGAYAPKNEMNETGRYMIGNVHNSLAPSFSLPSLKRFQYVDNNKHFPGPGTYAPKIGISENGSQYISNIKSPTTRTFYHSDRVTIDIPSHIRKLPGPGAYKIPTDFGMSEIGGSPSMKKSSSQPILEEVKKSDKKKQL